MLIYIYCKIIKINDHNINGKRLMWLTETYKIIKYIIRYIRSFKIRTTRRYYKNLSQKKLEQNKLARSIALIKHFFVTKTFFCNKHGKFHAGQTINLMLIKLNRLTILNFFKYLRISWLIVRECLRYYLSPPLHYNIKNKNKTVK